MNKARRNEENFSANLQLAKWSNFIHSSSELFLGWFASWNCKQLVFNVHHPIMETTSLSNWIIWMKISWLFEILIQHRSGNIRRSLDVHLQWRGRTLCIRRGCKSYQICQMSSSNFESKIFPSLIRFAEENQRGMLELNLRLRWISQNINE